MKLKQNIRLITLITASIFLIGGLKLPTLLAAPAPRSQRTSVNANGEIKGTVKFEGTKPTLQQIYMTKDPECVRENQGRKVYVQDGEVNSNNTLPNAFVFIESGAQGHQYAPPKTPVILDQQGCIFVPHVLGIMVGQTLKVLNSDFTTHNVHVLPKYNPQWNQSQPPGAAPFYKKFVHKEIMIPVKCNEHPWMRAYIGVVNNPFYDVTGTKGAFTIKGVPPGQYTLEAWTATFGTQRKTVAVRAGKTATVDFTFRHQ